MTSFDLKDMSQIDLDEELTAEVKRLRSSLILAKSHLKMCRQALEDIATERDVGIEALCLECGLTPGQCGFNEKGEENE